MGQMDPALHHFLPAIPQVGMSTSGGGTKGEENRFVWRIRTFRMRYGGDGAGKIIHYFCRKKGRNPIRLRG
jgi:hypothetical protein